MSMVVVVVVEVELNWVVYERKKEREKQTYSIIDR